MTRIQTVLAHRNRHLPVIGGLYLLRHDAAGRLAAFTNPLGGGRVSSPRSSQRLAMTVRRWITASGLLVYAAALVVGVVAGLLAHSGVVASAAALAFAVAWKLIGRPR